MVEFEWDEHNIEHVGRHGLVPAEVEQAMADPGRRQLSVRQPRDGERRYGLIGKIESGRMISVIFVRRNRGIRVITARDADASERRSYRTR
ncbi:MAG: BrnT family toxin [Dehalococcoidia bacterium]|nr:BrnT family toxin [Dehalococcoidia bacterium]